MERRQVIQPSNWSRLHWEPRAEPALRGPEEIRRSVIAAKAAKHAMASWTMPGIQVV